MQEFRGGGGKGVLNVGLLLDMIDLYQNSLVNYCFI